jgi:predicted MFS family arabinose efflux permease
MYLTRIVGEQDRGVAVSAFITTRTASQIAGNPLAGYLAEHYGYRAMFVVLAAISALGLVIFGLSGLGRPGDDRE